LEGIEQKHNGKFILAVGEVTGYSHQLLCPQMTITNAKRNFIDLLQEAELVHQQHKILRLIGKFAQVQEREIDHFSQTIKKVVD